MRDAQGNRIKEDGVMLVHRSYYGIPLGTGLDGQPITQVVEVRDGEARLPHKWTLACVYVWWFYYLPVCAVFPGDNRVLAPIVPGYLPKIDEDGQPAKWRDFGCYRTVRHGSLTMIRSSEDLKAARVYLQSIADQLSEKDRESSDAKPYDFRLPKSKYERVREAVDRELQRIESEIAEDEEGAVRLPASPEPCCLP